MTAVM